MNPTQLATTARALVAPGKGILAADESSPTIKKRFDSIGVESTADARRDYRELMFRAPGSQEFISGVILYDETLRQNAKDGTPLVKVLSDLGIIPGIKVDMGAKPLAGCSGELVTEGLDGLRDRLAEYAALGARFAKWRAVITIGEGMPSQACYTTNAHALARYAALCQEAGIVPIVEPEVLMDGKHSIARSEEVTNEILHLVFGALYRQGVYLEGMLLKPNMVMSGYEASSQASVQEVAEATVRTFQRHVPAAVPGIVFLSGGQSDELATEHLSAMNALKTPRPWELSFSYGRALQAAALKAWKGKPDNTKAAQEAYLHRARCNSAARYGTYTRSMEAGATRGDKLVSQD
ncbi:MAG: fructose-bisphosphate aldolase class I [Planctomycetes bacterium]|nr:fructose-bisphosphate aldolase class I [Planctomycetota bacterium]MCB9910465.1 fructose-bisphosphate aldolase class I [Planctomycetota bacterium]MCB9912591.1 fructose-bisphosphate aldolase class I [Planctomycetota bacterium]